MPRTLYRYILLDLLKWLAMSTAALVVVISIALAIKPLSEGLLPPLAFIKFVVFTSPTTLQFVLPFTGAFAATMVFTRMTASNEVLACSASGMSYRMILLPVAFLGVVLLLAMFFLANWAVPWCYERASRTVQQDVVSAIITQLEQRHTVIIKDVAVYAEQVQEAELSPEELVNYHNLIDLEALEGTPKYFKLTHVCGAQLDGDGAHKLDIVAANAVVLFYQADGQGRVLVKADDATCYDARVKLLQKSGWAPPAMPISNRFTDRPQFLSGPSLDRLSREPQTYDKIRDGMKRLRSLMGQEQLLDEMESRLRLDGQELKLVGPGDEPVFISAPRVNRTEDGLWLGSEGGRPVIVRYERAGRTVREDRAVEGVLRLKDDPWSAPALSGELTTVRVQTVELTPSPDGQGGITNELAKVALPELRWPRQVSASVEGQATTLTGTLDLARRKYLDSERVRDQVDQLEADWRSLDVKIQSQKHQRAAAAVTAMLVLVLGAVLSLLWRQRTPLPVFLGSFMLAVLQFALVKSGATLMGGAASTSHSIGASISMGLLFNWLGCVVILATTLWAYLKVARN